MLSHTIYSRNYIGLLSHYGSVANVSVIALSIMGGQGFNSPWVLYILAFWFVIFTKSKTPSALPVYSQGLPVHSQCTPRDSQCTPRDSQCTPRDSYKRLIGTKWGVQWEWTGSVWGVSGSRLGVDWESMGVHGNPWGSVIYRPGQTISRKALMHALWTQGSFAHVL